MHGEWLRKPSSQTAVVFVHGILSSSEKCWQHDNGSYWPELLKKEPEFAALGIYVYNYQTGFSSGSYSLSNVVDDFKERLLTLDDVAECKNILFVCHSMGGIVVRKFIVERVNDLLDRNIEVGLYMVASPSLGSDYANWLEPIAKFAGHEQAKALKFSRENQWLNDLDKSFINLKESKRLKIYGKELLEDKFITFNKLFRKQVVEPFSGARYFGESLKIANSDHSTIAKPQNSEATQHRLLCSFIKDAFNSSKATQLDCQENSMEINFAERYLTKRLDDALSSFSSQPKVWVEPILSKCSEVFSREAETSDNIQLFSILSNPKSTIIKAPPQFGLTCLSHYLTLEAWRNQPASLWLYLDSSILKPHTNVIEKVTNAELTLLGRQFQDVRCVILDSWTGHDDDSLKLLKKVCAFFENVPIIVMNTVNDLQLLNACHGATFDREFDVIYLWALSRGAVRKIVSDYNSTKVIGNEDAIITRVISDLDVLNLHRTPLNCLTLLKVSELDFQESPVNRAEMIQRVLFILFNVDDIPTYKVRPDLKDCEYVLGYFCEILLRENKYIFSRNYFIEELNKCCKNRYIDLEVQIVFDVLFSNNIIIKFGDLFRFKFAYWFYYFIAQRMCHDIDFAKFILEDMRYTRFPEVIEFYTGIDRQREDALKVLIQDIRSSSDRVQERCGLPEKFNPFRLCKWQASPRMLEQMQNEISNGVQDSNLPDSIKDSYTDLQHDRARPYNQEIRDILSEFSYVVMMQAMKAGSRALRNSDYVDPEIKRLLLQEIMKCWEQISKVLVVLMPFLAEEGRASFDGQSFTLRGNFGDTPLQRLQNILLAIPFNIVNFNQDDLFSQKMGPLFIGQINNEDDELKKHILILLLIHQRPREWKNEVEKYIAFVEKDSFYLFDIYNILRVQYKYSYASHQSLKDIEYLIKLSSAKHASGRKLPGEKQLKKVPKNVIPIRE
jgi:hypothetical protein